MMSGSDSDTCCDAAPEALGSFIWKVGRPTALLFLTDVSTDNQKMNKIEKSFEKLSRDEPNDIEEGRV